MRSADPGFLPGTAVGGVLVALTLWLGTPAAFAVAGSAGTWMLRNLGGSAWAFAIVLALWGWHLAALRRALDADVPEADVATRIVQLDQLSDVWMHLFVGIGVVWTAIGMRAALQTTLGDPEAALSDSAGSVLQGLVDGGILLALTTTIVGAVGGYLMRLAKTLWIGAALHGHYDAEGGRELSALLAATRRIESSLRFELGDEVARVATPIEASAHLGRDAVRSRADADTGGANHETAP